MNNIPQFQMLQCTSPACHFRFPIVAESGLGNLCPQCGEVTAVSISTYTNQSPPPFTPVRRTLSVLIDNVRSTYNVGSFFRTADGVGGIDHLYLCGITPTPDNNKVAKTALGAEQSVSWSYHLNGLETAVSLQQQEHQLWAIEGTAHAESLFETAVPLSPITLILGNELAGVDPAILALCHKIIAIPMHGQKSSLNVASAFAIAAYQLTHANESKGNS